MKNGLKIDKDGNKFWYQDDHLHREDGPATEYISGTKCWYQKGQFHRESGPAVEWADDNKSWHVQGQRLDCSTQEQFEKLMKLKAFW